MRDTAGLTSTAQITVTIQGANDAPTAVNDTAIAREAGGTNNGTAGINPSGNVVTNDTDIDAGDTKTVVGVAAGSLLALRVRLERSFGLVRYDHDQRRRFYTYNVDNNKRHCPSAANHGVHVDRRLHLYDE